MTMVRQYAVFANQVDKNVGNVQLTPNDTLDFGFAPDVDIYDFGQGAGLPLVSGANVDVGFGMKILKDGSKLPHNLLLLQIDDASPGYTPAPGLSNNALEDAVALGLKGYVLTPANALSLAQHLFPAVTVTDPEGNEYAYGAPYLGAGDVIMRDCTFTPA